MTRDEFEKYYHDNFNNFVKKYCRRCGSIYDAEDVVQDAFERALIYLVSCKDVNKWFNTILKNSYRDYLNKTKSWPVTKPIDDHLEEVEPVWPTNVSDAMVDEIDKLTEKEDEPNKTVLQLHLRYGFSSGEINRIVAGLSVKKIDNILYYWKKKLTKSM